MIPSRNWFPQSLQERAAWFQNFATQFTVLGPTMGFAADDTDQINNDNDVFQFLASETVSVDAFKDGWRQFRITLSEGDDGDPNPNLPVFTPQVAPTGRKTGIFERLDAMVKRIRVAPLYTPEAGALLGIIPSKPDSIGEADLKPVIKASESFSNYKFTLNVTRLGQEAFKVQILRNGNGNWTDNGFATSNPFDVTVTPTTPGQPERVQVRAILLQKNEPVGQPSDPTYVTVNP
ncbi:MAG TPA: hypothetical protein VGQ55_14530 [Pyrinomonadaceae bacterium]|nr:hypothetical protein [Pyrinomonadaceae bacterium]